MGPRQVYFDTHNNKSRGTPSFFCLGDVSTAVSGQKLLARPWRRSPGDGPGLLSYDAPSERSPRARTPAPLIRPCNYDRRFLCGRNVKGPLLLAFSEGGERAARSRYFIDKASKGVKCADGPRSSGGL